MPRRNSRLHDSVFLLAIHVPPQEILEGAGSMVNIRLIKHEAVPKCGSFEVCFADGGPSRYFYWDDVASRRTRPERMISEQVLEKAKAFARTERAG